MNKLNRPLITGAGGFVGSHLAKQLAELPDTEMIYCVDLPNSVRFAELQKIKKVTIIEVDLSREDSFKNLPEDVTGVFCLAALNGTQRFYEEPFTVLQGSILPTIFALKRYAKVCPILYTSSSEVYASTISNFHGEVPTPENIIPSIEDVHNPRWSYGTAKLLGEVAVNAASIEFGAETVIVRYHNVYGSNMGVDHFVPDFVNRVKHGTYEISGASESRAFLHISDAVIGTIKAFEMASLHAPIYHLGSDEELLIIDAAKVILKEMGKDWVSLTHLPDKVGSVKRRQAMTNKAFNDFGWKAKISFEQGIKMYLDES